MTVSWRAYTSSEYVLLGNHGWDNLNQEMQAMFIGQGPSFRQGLVAAPFHNIELYNLMSAMIGIEPAPNNGTWGALHHLLVDPPSVADRPAAVLAHPPLVLPYPDDQQSYNERLNRRKCSLLTTLNDPSTVSRSCCLPFT